MRKIILNPQYKSLYTFIETLPQNFNAGGEIVQDRRNTIKKFKVNGLEINVKRYRVPIFINRIAYTFFRKSKACDCTALLSVCPSSDCKALSYLCVFCSDNPFAKIRLHRPNVWKYQLCISPSVSMFPSLRIEPIRIETVCCRDSVAMTD